MSTRQIFIALCLHLAIFSPRGAVRAQPATEPATGTPSSPASDTGGAEAPAAEVVAAPPAAQSPASASVLSEWRVRSGNKDTRGVVVGDEHLLVTTAHAVGGRGSIQLRSADGRRVPATVVHADERTGLVVLHADESLGSPAQLGSAAVGDVVFVGQGSAVVVYAENGRLTLSAGCEPGAPARDRSGALVAVCTSATAAVAASGLPSVVHPQQPSVPSRWRMRLLGGLSYRLQRDFEGAFGGEIGVGVIGYDRVAFVARALFYERSRAEAGGLTVGAVGDLVAEVQLHHAFRVGPVPVRLAVGGGVLMRRRATRVTQDFLEIEPGCDPTMERCAVSNTQEVTRTREFVAHPYVRLELMVSSVTFSYAAAIDTRNIASTMHMLTVGTGF